MAVQKPGILTPGEEALEHDKQREPLMACAGGRHRPHYGNERVMRIEGIIDNDALAYALFAIFQSLDVE